MERDCRGYTLVEAAVAMLLTAVVAGSVFSVALTAKRSSGRDMRRFIADQASRQLSERLKDYVTADNSATQVGQTGISGPVVPTDPDKRWGMAKFKMPGNADEVTDSCGACWALDPGTHTLAGYLPKWFEDPPFDAEISYFVPAVAPTDPREVVVTVKWTDL